MELEATIADHVGRLAELTEIPADAPSPGQAERALSDAEAAVKSAELNEEAARTAHAEHLRAIYGLEQQVAAASERLESAAAVALVGPRDADLADRLVELAELKAAFAAEDQSLQALHPEALSADVLRLTNALRALDNERQSRRDRIIEAKTRLDAFGADGVDERAAEAMLARDSAQARLNQLHLRASALRLLCTRLQENQQQAIERLYAPLHARLQHYLAMLFPEASTKTVIEDLGTTGLRRDGLTLRLDDYSYGTREQLGVLARLGYADLLREAGQPTLLILDDALVHSDPNRRAQMQRILFDAAQRHQILLLTCRREDWVGAGASHQVDVGALTRATSG
jgi:hypothetical protein